MKPAFKLPRTRAAADASHAAQAERVFDGPKRFLLRRKLGPEHGKVSGRPTAPTNETVSAAIPNEREDLARAVSNLRQRHRQQRERWSKSLQVSPGVVQGGQIAPENRHAIGKGRVARDLPAEAIRDTLQKIRQQREQWSASKSAGLDPAGDAQVESPTPSRELPVEQQGQKGAIVVDRPVPELAARPANHLRTGLWIIALLVAGAVATGIHESERLVSAVGKARLFVTALLPRTGVHGTDSRRGPVVPPAPQPAESIPSRPMPDSYGLFVVTDGQLKRLETMRMRVPDTRIALGGLITKPSPVTLADGKLSFIAYQRDLITNAPDNASVRVIAKVQRALKFSAAGKPVTTPVEDTWAVRSVSVDLTVAPVAESQEMVLLRPSDPELTLSPGRYMLVYKNQAYDFAVAGAITDIAQCLERTDSQDGAVYSECRELP